QRALELGARLAPFAERQERESVLELLAQAAAERSGARQEPRPALRAVAVLVGIGRLAAWADHPCSRSRRSGRVTRTRARGARGMAKPATAWATETATAARATRAAAACDSLK